MNYHESLAALPPAIREDLETRIAIVQHKLKHLTDKPQWALVNTIEPFEGGLIDADLNAFAGGEQLIVNSWEELKAKEPHVVLFAPTGKTLSEGLSGTFEKAPLDLIKSLFAMKSQAVYIVQAELLHPATIEAWADALELLGELLHPKQFRFGFEGTGFVRLDL